LKAILEFNLPEDRVEYDMANNASNYHNTLWEFDQKLRAIIKYDDKDFDQETAQKIRDLLYEKMNENNINIDLQ
jgi:hypothetical protein